METRADLREGSVTHYHLGLAAWGGGFLLALQLLPPSRPSGARKLLRAMLGAVAAGMPWTVSSLVRRGNYPILLISSIGTNNSRAQASAVGSSIRDVSGTLVLLQTPLHLSVLAPRVVARVDSGVLTQLLVEVRCNIAGIDTTSVVGHQVTLNATENPPLDEPWLRFEGASMFVHRVRLPAHVNALEAEYVVNVPQLEATFAGFFRTVILPH